MGILVDQTAYLAVYNSVYYISLGMLAGEGVAAVKKLIRDFWPMQTAGWKLWPFIGLITYNFIPIQNRVLFIDVVEIFYSAILSLVANNSEMSKTASRPPHAQMCASALVTLWTVIVPR